MADADIYLSLPGLGDVLGARVLGDFGDAPDRYASAKSRKNYAGTSSLTVASGKKRAVLARYVRNRRLYDAIDQWAFCSMSSSPGRRAFYDQHRAAGISITRRYAPSATAPSASSTAVSKAVLSTTRRRPGPTGTRTFPRPLDKLRRWGV